MNPMTLRRPTALLAATILLMATATSALAATFHVNYTGQGFEADGLGGYDLKSERCAEGQNANDGGTGQFANWNGPGQPYQTGQGYLVWVLTANGASSATLTLPDGTVNMFKVGGTFKYASKWYDPATLFPGNQATGTPVYASYERNSSTNAQLVVSHGCRPFVGNGAWCSPGYWRNAANAAWTLIGVSKTALFNDTVVPNFYDTASAANPTLIQVLTTPGANTFGAASDPFGLNAFNATGAYLTDQIPGYSFDPNRIGDSDACPIDHHGNFKNP
jgi:hypothetical protein